MAQQSAAPDRLQLRSFLAALPAAGDILCWASRGLGAKIRIKRLLGLEHAVSQVQQFSHGRTNDEHLGFALSREAQPQRFDERIETKGRDSREVEGLAQP